MEDSGRLLFEENLSSIVSRQFMFIVPPFIIISMIFYLLIIPLFLFQINPDIESYTEEPVMNNIEDVPIWIVLTIGICWLYFMIFIGLTLQRMKIYENGFICNTHPLNFFNGESFVYYRNIKEFIFQTNRGRNIACKIKLYSGKKIEIYRNQVMRYNYLKLVSYLQKYVNNHNTEKL